MSRSSNSTRRWSALLCLFFAALVFPQSIRAESPVRLLVVTNGSQLLPTALQSFEEKYGRGRIRLYIVGEDVTPDQVTQADAVFVYYVPNAVLERLAPAVRTAHQRGALVFSAPVQASERIWNLKQDSPANRTAEQYWKYGGVDNLSSFLAFIYRSARKEMSLQVPPPQPQMEAGIYHPQAAHPFSSLTDYLVWYRSAARVPDRAPLAGILMYSNTYKFRDLAHINALIAALERRGIGAVPIFGWPISTLQPLLTADGNCPLRVVFALNLTISKADDAATFEKYGVHVINLLTSRETYEEWSRSVTGVPPDRIRTLLNAPERAGASEPIMFATFESVPGSQTKVTKPIPERLEAAVQRAQRWLALQDKPNEQKRIALLYYNNPPGKGNLGASYMAIFPSIAAILQRLHDAGYRTSPSLPDERQLIQLLERSGRNVELWAPGELQDMVENGSLTLVSLKKYKSWFAKLPRPFREATIRRWGSPEQSKLMTITSRDGEKFFVIPGIRMGNIFVGPQPLRSTFEEAANMAHDTVTPVPHQYIAAYMWYRHEFKADAITHIGRHGTLEWLPGKQAGQAGWDTSEVLLGDLPNPYYYVMDGGGEAIQAKRRSAGVMISHLTPLIVKSGTQERFRTLHDAVEAYEKVQTTSPELANEYQRQILTETKRLQLDAQLNLDLAKTEWSEIQERLEAFLHTTEADPIPIGIHTAGQLPPDSVQREALSEFIRSNFTDEEWRLLPQNPQGLADAVFDGCPALIDSVKPRELHTKLQNVLTTAEEWLRHLRQSPQMELDALITVLSGRYLPTGPLGDPIRTPLALPSGRNLHAFDGSFIPTKAAWNLGKTMAEQMIARYQKDKGSLPEKVSMVLWYGETERHQGAMECMAMYLLGVEPVWNPRGIVDNLRLIPDTELGRPRIDVIFTISGIYRDGFGDKLLLLDKAVRLAASAGDNAISRHDRENAASLRQSGVKADVAEKLARARVFSTKPGNYGIGIVKLVEQSKDADGHTDDLAKLYLNYMNFAFSSEIWGETGTGALQTQLKGNQAVLFSRSSNLYGALDNDDTYQYVGGLNATSRFVNEAAPQFYIHNLRRSGSESVVDMKTWLTTELNARHWNPKWIKGMQNAGYAGAREMFKEIEHLYGFQATSAEQMDGTFWQNTYDVFVKDKYSLKMEEFFEKNNPYAAQWITSRLLEVDRQGSYKFSAEDRANLIRRYVGLVAKHGVTCSANTCGNEKVHQYIGQQATLISGLGNQQLREFGQKLARATNWKPSDFHNAVPAMRAGMRQAQAKQRQASPAAQPEQPKPTLRPYVQGFEMSEKTLKLSETHPVASFSWTWLAAMFLLLTFGALWEMKRS